MLSEHVVQFYGKNERDLLHRVRLFISEGLARHEAVLVITSARRTDDLFERLNLSETPGLTVVDATVLCDRLYQDGRISAERFEAQVGSLVRRLSARARSRGLRVYGDMVDELWNSGRRDDAIDLERYWNDLQAQVPFTLYCAYHIEPQDVGTDVVAPLLHEHSSLVPALG